MKKKSLTVLREERHLTQEKLAKKVGVTARTIRTWESDREFLRNAKVKNIVKLCKVLKIDINALQFPKTG